MNLGEKAFEKLFPEKSTPKIAIKYSNRFKAWNANVKYSSKSVRFGFSKKWKNVSEDIQMGLAQHLLLKAYKEDKKTTEIELYQKFMEKLPEYASLEEVEADPELEESFERINEEYFDGFMEKPNLEWGRKSMSLLGSFSYQTNTVRISTIFQESPEWMLDYVVYHELLHKKFGIEYGEKGGCRHHTPEFRKEEAKFRVEDAEKKLKTFVRKQKNPSLIRNIFK